MTLSYTQDDYYLSEADLLSCFANFLRVDVASGAASADTIKTYACQTKKYFQWCAEQKISPLHATREDLKEYRRYLIEIKKYKSATVAFKLIVVRRLYTAAVENGLLTTNPAVGISPPVESIDPAERITYLEQTEIPTLLSAIPNDSSVASLRDRTLVAIMLLEGTRTVEMHRSDISNIVRRGINLGLQVKSKRSRRVVPLTPDLALLLQHYLQARSLEGEILSPECPLFVSLARSAYKQRLSRRSIQRIVNKYLESSQLKHTEGRTLTTHSLRHTAGTTALRTGADLRQVQDLLGHADPRTTAIYAHVADRWANNPALNFGVKLF
jgi:site-specific recombinase XerD